MAKQLITLQKLKMRVRNSQKIIKYNLELPLWANHRKVKFSTIPVHLNTLPTTRISSQI